MNARRIALAAALVIGSFASSAAAQVREAPASEVDVLQGIEPIAEPVRTFLPKYKFELFLVAGYSGTFTSERRQWPTLVLGLDELFFRPGCFDFGVYVDWQVGRADDSLGRFSSAFGLEIMWRALELSFMDLAPLIRGAYVLDWETPSHPLLRPGAGVQVSLLRFVALQATVDGLFALSHDFSNDTHALIGFSIMLKLGIPPFVDAWPRYAEPSMPTIDRSRAVCDDAARMCQAADRSHVRAQLCAAALSALDPAKHTAGWGDPTGAYLDAVQQELEPNARQALETELRALREAHQSSVQGLERYADKQRALEEGQILSKKYSYLVTPVMIRDWLGCNADDDRLDECATSQACARDTGVASP